MQITTADIDHLASADITQRMDGPAGPFYRRVFNMRFETAGIPDGIHIESDTATFSALFSSKTYDVLDDDNPVHAVETQQPDARTVLIRLDRPWRIKRITLKSTHGKAYADTVAAASANHLWTCAATPDHLVLEAEHLEVEHQQYQYLQGVTFQLFRVDGDAIAEEPTTTAASGAVVSSDFISAAFALRALDSSREPMDLRLADLAAVEVETYPTGPRIGLAEPGGSEADASVDAYFWQVPGEIRDAGLYETPNSTAGKSFGDALQRHLNERLALLASQAKASEVPFTVPDHLDVALVVDSDAPCGFESELSVAYYLIRNTFTLPESGEQSVEKQVLRFDGSPSRSLQVAVRLPQDAVLSSAALELDASFGCPPASPVGGGVEPVPAALPSGVHLTMDRWAAQPVVLTEALTLTQIAVGVMALESATELAVALRADHGGLPDGQILVEQQIALPTAGARNYARAVLKKEVPLAAQNYWILLKALSGSAVWLTRVQSQSKMIIAQTTASCGVSAPIAQLDSVQSYFALFSRNTQASQTGAPVMLQVGGHPVGLTAAANGRLQAGSAELTAGLNACLTAPTVDCLTTEAGMIIPLKLTATSKGMLTVYAPRLTYSMGTV